MAENRAKKSGFAAEAQEKMNAKYDEQLTAQLLCWIKELTGSDIGTDGSMDNLFETLKDGTLLCQLINKFDENLQVKKVNQSKMAFKCMENITAFLDIAQKLGLQSHELFQTCDLWERQNLTAVMICLQALARKAYKHGLQGVGPKEADANVRSFTPEQLRAGEAIISLQYGSNKGATQSGINFGNTRHM